jgi:SAM-dependent methyltransferase
MPSAAEDYAALCDAVQEQQLRLFGPAPSDIWTGQSAVQFRFDPRRELDPNLAALASYVMPDDVVLDVGGGAGRVSLPLALRCREVLTVEPSAGMAAEYEGSKQEAGITNARLLPASLMDAEGVVGDVAVTCDVTYFIRDIVPFIEKMQSAARRRVMILVWSEPPPNRGGDLFRRVYDEPLAPMPGHRQLLPVLWDMGVLPDVRVLPAPTWWEDWHHATRDEALESVIFGRWSREGIRDTARRIFNEQFDELFVRDGDGYRAIWRQPMRELLITWETGG